MSDSGHLWCGMAPIDLNLLRVFATVHDGGSFSAAAGELGVPRSTVSRAIAALEERIGEPLFHRTTRSMQVTRAGTALYARIAPSLGTLGAALEDLAVRTEEPSGTVTVTSTVDIGMAVFAEAAARFAIRWPRVRVDAILTPRIVDFDRDGIDLSLRIFTSKLPDSRLVARKVGTVDFHLFASPSYLARRGTPRSPADFPAHDWVGFRASAVAGFARALVENDFGGPARILCDDMFFLREAVRRGAGIAPIPAFVAEEDRKSGVLVRVLPRWTFSSGTVYLVQRPPRMLPPRVVAFRELVIDVLRQRPLS